MAAAGPVARDGASPSLRLRVRRTLPSGFVLDVDAQVDASPGVVTAILGPSGCGKTTLLRCVAGLETVDDGEIVLGDRVWTRTAGGTQTPAWERRVGWVPQEGALFPHLDVAHNVAYAAPDAASAQRAVAALDLTALSTRLPQALSGGQKQRVALARALAAGPTVLLLDEPLSALDAGTREETRAALQQHLRNCGVPALLVTHDRLDVLRLAQRVIIMEGGRVLQQGTVANVFAHPANAAVARITGVDTVVEGQVEREADGLTWARVGTALVAGVAHAPVGSAVLLCVRGEDVVVQREKPAQSSARNRLTGRVVSLEDHGPLCRIQLDVGFALGALVTRAAAAELGLQPGVEAHALFKAQAVTVLPRG